MCWDRRDGRPLSPVFSWQDRRAHLWLRQFEARGEEVHRKTGLFLSAHYGAGTALEWLRAELRIEDVLSLLPQWLATPCEPPLFFNGIAGLGGPLLSRRGTAVELER